MPIEQLHTDIHDDIVLDNPKKIDLTAALIWVQSTLNHSIYYKIVLSIQKHTSATHIMCGDKINVE